MYDQTLIIEIVSQIISAIETVEERFKVVNNVNDFTDSPSGMEKLDSICMLLIGKVQKV